MQLSHFYYAISTAHLNSFEKKKIYEFFCLIRFIINLYRVVKELSNPDPLHARPKAHAEEKETPDDEQRES